EKSYGRCRWVPRARGGWSRLAEVVVRMAPRGAMSGAILRARKVLTGRHLPPPGEDSAMVPPKVVESSGQRFLRGKGTFSGGVAAAALVHQVVPGDRAPFNWRFLL